MKKTSLRHGATAESGAALIAAVLFVAILGLSTSAVLQFYHLSFDQQARAQQDLQAWHAAEGALHKAIAALRHDPQYTGEADTPLGLGGFSVEVERDASSDTYRLRATGISDRAAAAPARTVLVADVVLAPDGAVQSLHFWEASPWDS
jgi:type II secretory pathway component PulK